MESTVLPCRYVTACCNHMRSKTVAMYLSWLHARAVTSAAQVACKMRMCRYDFTVMVKMQNRQFGLTIGL